ncbi:hypothetical protein CGC20_2220 [Leishmania donovani]|uniref:LisH domain-containing protein n=1 Tax=Leishmania donovani TaxID=5661 RepID=A0A504XWT1_LEIDO|nr:hypothetical protein CGC20_2220 [Leishmania donovani]
MSSSHTERAVSRTQGVQGSTPTNAGSSKLGTLSVSELRTAMQQHLRSTGALRELKTQLRGMVLAEILQQPKTARMLVHGASQSVPPSLGEGQRKLDDSKASAAGSPGTPAIAIVSGRADHTLQTWSCGLADALVENHLRRTRRAMSLSIFSTEAEVPPFSVSGAPAEEEQYLAHLFRQIDAGTSANPEDDILAPSPSHSMKSVLQRLVEDYVARQGLASTAEVARHLHSCSTQTEAADCADSATNPLNSLECRLAAVDAKYALTFAQLKRTGGSGEQPFFLRSEVERRLQQHKNDMHAQLRSEYEQKYNSFTRVKLQEARDEAEGRYRLLAQNKTEELAEMERSLLVKLEQERQRLKMAWEDVHQQRAELERRQRDTIKQLADYDAAKQQSDAELHSWKEKTRALQLQCAKWEELCGTRLMELDGARSREERRVEDIRRLQAEHAAELQLKEEEIGRLRYRLRLVSRESDYSHSTAAAAAAASTGRNENTDTSTVPQAPPRTSTAPVDPQQLYGLLLPVYPLPSSEGQVARRSPDRSESSDNQVAAASTPVAAIMSASTSAATPATSSPKVSSPAPTDTATAAKPPPSSADKPRESSASSKKSLSTRASVAPPSSSVSSTHPTPQKPTSVPDVEAQAAESLTSSSTRMSTSSSSVPSSTSAMPVQPSVHNADDDSKNKTAATALLSSVTEEEQSGRDEVQSEEASARDSIAWLERNRRELLTEDLKRARSEGGVVSPWKHFGGGSSGPQFGGTAAAADVDFNESFSSDDAALIHDSDEDDVEF